MQFRKLGNSSIEVSCISFGAWAIGGWMWGGADDEAAVKAIRASFDSGVTTIDTAPVYGFGKSEELVGKAMQGISREKYQILTKFGMNWETPQGEYFFDSVDNDGKPFKMYKWSSKEKIISECEQSLRRLKTDYIDVYQIHWPDATTPVYETFEAISQLQRQGKIRAAGVCNYSSALVEEALKSIVLVSNQVPYSLINRDIEKDIIPQALQKGLSIIPYSPLQRGLLTGKIKPGHHFGEGDTRKGNRFYTEESITNVHHLLAQIQPLAEKYNATVGQVIINWTICQPGIGTVLVGARDTTQVKENVKSVEFSLAADEIEKIREAAIKYF